VQKDRGESKKKVHKYKKGLQGTKQWGTVVTCKRLEDIKNENETRTNHNETKSKIIMLCKIQTS
jgi:hypothetical protein